MRRGIAGERAILVPPLPEGEEERDENRADEEPSRDLRLHRHRARHRAQHEASGHREHVEDDQVLEPDRVGGEEGAVAEGDQSEGGTDPVGGGETTREEEHAEDERGGA